MPDPADPDIVFGGKLTRYDRRTAQAQNIMPMSPGAADFRVIRTQPIAFSPFGPPTMFFAANTLWATHDGGRTWEQKSPDLTRKTYETPASVGIFSTDPTAQPKQRGVIYALALSPVDKNRMWAGTDDGLIWTTTDGGAHWNNVTPPEMSAWQKVSTIEASHSDPRTAYAAINTLRLDDLRPHIYRTHDGGKTWTETTSGIPENENTNAVREAPWNFASIPRKSGGAAGNAAPAQQETSQPRKPRGLLLAGTERAVYVSFDDGDHWQSLRLNMPRHFHSRPAPQRQRPRGRHPRTRLLDNGRHHAAA